MPPHYSRIPELKTPDNIIIDVKPMQNALMERRKAQEFDINKEVEQQRLEQQANQFQQTKNLQERQFGLQEQKFSQDASDRKIKMIGGMAQVIDEEQNPQARQVMWQRMRGATPEFDGLLQKYGVDPNDHVNGPKFVLAQIGQYDPMKRQERESTIRYRDAATSEMNARADARTADAGTRRFSAIANSGLLDRQDPISEAEWTTLNQPGGVIHAAFGGRQIPYAQAPVVLAQARREFESQFEPTAEERVMGITRENKIAAYRQSRINEMWGVDNKTSAQKGIRVRPDGSGEAIPGWGNTQNERQGAVIAKQGLKLLEDGEKMLKDAGTTGQLAGDSWKVPGTNIDVGGWGEGGRGFAAIKSAIIDLNFALSGKSVSNAERQAFLDLYMPKSTDSAKTQAFKLSRIRSYFTEVLRMREGNASDDDVASAYQRALKDGMKGPDAPDQKGQERLPGKGGGWGIRRLD